MVKYKRGSKIKVVVSGIAYFSLWSCSKVDLNMDNQLGKLCKRGGSTSIEMNTFAYERLNNTDLSQDENKLLREVTHYLNIATDVKKIERDLNAMLPRSSPGSVRRTLNNRLRIDKPIGWSVYALRTLSSILSWACYATYLKYRNNSNHIDISYPRQQPNTTELENLKIFFNAQQEEYRMEIDGINERGDEEKKATPQILIFNALGLEEEYEKIINSFTESYTRRENNQNSYDPMVILLFATSVLSSMQVGLDFFHGWCFRMDTVNYNITDLRELIDSLIEDYRNTKEKLENYRDEKRRRQAGSSSGSTMSTSEISLSDLLEEFKQTIGKDGRLTKSLKKLDELLKYVQNIPENRLCNTGINVNDLRTKFSEIQDRFKNTAPSEVSVQVRG